MVGYIPGYPIDYVRAGGKKYMIFELGEPVFKYGHYGGTVWESDAFGNSFISTSSPENARVVFRKSGYRFLIDGRFPTSNETDLFGFDSRLLYCIPIQFTRQIVSVEGKPYRCAYYDDSIALSDTLLVSYDHLPEHVPIFPGYVFISKPRYDLGTPLGSPKSHRLEADVSETLSLYRMIQSVPSEDPFGLTRFNLDPLIRWLHARVHFESYSDAYQNQTSFIAVDKPGLFWERQLLAMQTHLQRAIQVDSAWVQPQEKLSWVEESIVQHNAKYSDVTKPSMGRRLKIAPDLNWYSGSSGNDENALVDAAELRVGGNVTFQLLNNLGVGLGIDIFAFRQYTDVPQLSEPSWFLDTPYILVSYQLPIRVQWYKEGMRLQISAQFRSLEEERRYHDHLFIAEGWACDFGIGLCGRKGFFYEDSSGVSGGNFSIGYRFGQLGEFHSTETDAVLVWGSEQIPVEVNPNHIWIRLRFFEYTF